MPAAPANGCAFRAAIDALQQPMQRPGEIFVISTRTALVRAGTITIGAAMTPEPEAP